MIESMTLASLNRVALPERYDINVAIEGLVVRRRRHSQRIVDATLAPFRARGTTWRWITPWLVVLGPSSSAKEVE
jgi:hypothetical protein